MKVRTQNAIKAAGKPKAGCKPGLWVNVFGGDSEERFPFQKIQPKKVNSSAGFNILCIVFGSEGYVT